MSDGRTSLSSRLFGHVRWEAPAWLLTVISAIRRGTRRLDAARKQAPRKFWGIFGLILLLVVIAIAGYVAWRLMPVPVQTHVQVSAPGITRMGTGKNADKLYPQPVTIHFSTEYTDPTQRGARHAARLSLMDKDLDQGIKLSPKHPGTWRWIDEDTLRFTTKKPWPANTKYTVQLESDLFASGINLAHSTPSFTTSGIQVKINQIRLYQNPEKPSEHRIVATLGFTYPVDPDSLKKHLQLTMRPSGKDIQAEPQDIDFKIKLDRHDRIAYVTSSPVPLPPEDNFATLTLDKGITAANGDSATSRKMTSDVRVPAVSTFFRVQKMQARIVRNQDGEPLQTLVLKVTDGIKATTVADKLQAYLLPRDTTLKDGKVAITPALLGKSEPVDLKANPSVHPYAKLMSFTFHAPESRLLYVKLPAGLVSRGGYTMTVPYRDILHTPSYPKEVHIVGDGSLLTLSGSKKIAIQTRGIPAIKAQVYRLRDSQFVHLLTQTRGDLSKARFVDYHFNENNIAKRYERVLHLHPEAPGQSVYTSLDLSRYLTRSGAARGMFIVTVQGWNPEKDKPIGGLHARRFILLTNLAVLVKDNADHTHDLFVNSLASGQPADHATIKLLGINGTPVYTTQTDERGHARIPDVHDFQAGRKPAVYVVHQGNDTSFLPFNRHDRKLNYSRFNVGGLHVSADTAQKLRAVAFTDRGLYRPGDNGHLGVIIKRNDWGAIAGIPVEIRLEDPQGKQVKRKRLTLPADGFVDMDFAFEPTAPTGLYKATVYLLDKKHDKRHWLGAVAFHVEMFTPDKLHLKTSLSEQHPRGWYTAMQYQAGVDLENLFGLPAQKHRVTGKYTLTPARFSFSKYPDYTFTNPFNQQKDPLERSVTQKLGETRTDKNGHANFDVDLSQYGRGVYWLTFTAKGFETGGGHSVSANTRIRVSPARRLVGWTSDSRLSYLPRGSDQAIRFIVIDPDLQAIAADNLRLKLVRKQPVSTLIEQNDGTLAYQTIVRKKVVDTRDFDIAAQGRKWSIPTDDAGDYVARIIDKDGRILASIDYTVAGAGNRAGSTTQNPKLKVDLDQSKYRPGDDIELQITSPYTGAGLITIERDKVYAYKWFKADSKRTIQHIRVPENLEGNAYVNVTFVRSPDSPDIFTQPLSYAVAPFAIDRSARTIGLDLHVPDKIKPGDTLPIRFKTDQPGHIVVYAVDEGILQVANYHLPQPLDTFLQKRALQVGTSQIADLLMPDYKLLKSKLSIGGGQQEASAPLNRNLNPFARKVQAPVVYWSGIVSATGKLQTVNYQVPDYFDGKLRVMAVAVDSTAIGAAETSTHVRGPFVLQPDMVTTAAPGDTFKVSVGVTNALPKGSGEAKIVIDAQGDKHLTLPKDDRAEITLSPGEEGHVTFRAQATDVPGPATLTFTARGEKHDITRTATLSVRPAVPYQTRIQTGRSTSGKGDLTPARTLQPAFATQTATLGYTPLVLARALSDYLNDYPFTCSEQMVSRVFGQLLLQDNPVLSLDRSKVAKRYHETLQALRSRQMPDGGFGFWPSSRQTAPLASVYATHFLTVARTAGMAVPEDIFKPALDYVRALATRNPARFDSPYVQAYAIYVLTRNHQVTTNYLTRLQTYLEQHSKTWRHSLAAAYMAASYKQLHLDDLAGKLISGVTFAKPTATYSHFLESPLAHDAQYLYLLTLHFPKKLAAQESTGVQILTKAINAEHYNTFSASYTLLSLGALATANDGRNLPLHIKAETGDETETLASGHGASIQADVPLKAKKVLFSGHDDTSLFYSLAQSGYDARLPEKPVKQSIEVTREYLNDKGKSVTEAPQGSVLTARIRVRGLTDSSLGHSAIIALLPGGFDIVRDSLRDWHSQGANYVDIREDRVVLYADIGPDVKTFTYKVRVTGQGSFRIPSVYVKPLYTPDTRAMSAVGQFKATAP